MDEPHEKVYGAVTEPFNDVAPAAPEPSGLRRSTKHRMVGGVAGGIGERFDIDANIVRVIFVVLTALFGLGVAIYLAMWVLIPQSGKVSDGDTSAPVTNTRLLSYVALAGVVVAVIIVLSTFNNRPRVGNGFAWLWLVFLVVLAVLSLRSSARQHMLRRFIALVFLVFLTFFILLIGAALGFLASTGVPMTGGTGERVVQPANAAQVQSIYRTEFGTMVVDLRQVHFPPGTRTIGASVTAGLLSIDLPSNAIVYLKTKVGIGHVEYNVQSGPTSQPFPAIPPSLNTAASQKNAPRL
ncbi:MAG: PspC domain-containing protein, partial [Acidimicrobiales bacterium]